MIETSCLSKNKQELKLKGYDMIDELEVTEKKIKKLKETQNKKKLKTPKVLKKPKKRGRKPKDKTINIVNKNINKSLIIHLPVKSSDINNNSFPKPYEASGIYDYSIYNENPKKSIKSNINNNLNNTSCKKIIDNNISANKLCNIGYSFLDNKKWPDKVLTLCPWCCHRFDNIPVTLPYTYISGVFKVSKFFCSYNCAAAYNFDLNDSKIWERYSLLNLMYKKINNCKFIKIPLSPNKEILKAFNGYMDIETYRKNLTFQKFSVDIIKNPVVSIIMKAEETKNEINIEKEKNKFIPINDDLMQNAEESLVIKRTKSIINKSNTLQSYMGLKIT